MMNTFSANTLSLNNINEGDNNLFTVNDLVDYSVGRSFTLEAVEYITESDKEYNSIKRILYKTIIESEGNEYIIHEGFSDFLSGVKNIINKFLAFIKSLFERFIIAMNKVVKSDKFLTKNKDNFKKFNNDNHGFSFNGYTFTLDTLPIIQAKEIYTDDLDDASETIKNIINSFKDNKIDYEKITDGISALTENLKDKLDTDWYDIFRGKIINSDPVTDTEFNNALFASFRNEDSDKYNIDVTTSYIFDAYNRFDGYKKLKDNIESTKKKVDKEYTDIKNCVDRFMKTKTSTNATNDMITALSSAGFNDIRSLSGKESELVKLELDKYINMKSNQIQSMSNIHAMAFAAKLDAAKDQYIQDKNVLYKALSKIKGTIHEEYIHEVNYVNDKGNEVPKVCPKCGSKVGVFLRGEPVFLCTNKKCGKFYGVVPFKEDTQINISINDSKVKIKFDSDEKESEDEYEDIPVSVDVLPDNDKSNDEEDEYDIVPFVDDDNAEPEIPTGSEDVDIKELEDEIDSLNAIEMDEVEESVNYAINTRHPSLLVGIKSSKNPNFGKNILESMFTNKVKYLTESQLVSDEIATSSNLEYMQWKLLEQTDEDRINKMSSLTESYKMYLNAINEKKKSLNTNISLSDNYVLEMAMAISKLHKDIDTSSHIRFIKECLLFGSDSNSDAIMNELAILEADETNSNKNAFEKFKDFIKKIWNKFVERVTYFVSNNKKYLDKYKDTILKKIPDLDISMKFYDKGIDQLVSTPIPLFNPNDSDSMTDEATYQAKILSGKKTIDGKEFKSGNDFSDFCVNLFTGGPEEKEQDSKSINMANVFDYCYNYESKIKVNLEKDTKTIEKSAEDATRLINKYEIEAQKEKNNKEKEENKSSENKNEPATPSNTQDKKIGESGIFSTYYGKYITEAPSFKATSTNDNTKTTSNNVADNLNSSSGEKTSGEDLDGKSLDELTNIKKQIEVYNVVVGQVMSAKIKAAEEIYNSYMKLIQAHIQNEINKNNAGTNRPVQTKDDYSSKDKK